MSGLPDIIKALQRRDVTFEVTAEIKIPPRYREEFYELLDAWLVVEHGDNLAHLRLIEWLDKAFPDIGFTLVPMRHIRFDTNKIMFPKVLIGEETQRPGQDELDQSRH